MEEPQNEESTFSESCLSTSDQEHSTAFPSAFSPAGSTENSPKETFFGPFSEKAAISREALQRGEVEALELENFTVGLALELFKHKSSLTELLQWITLLTPSEERSYLTSVNGKNLNKKLSTLHTKSQKLSKNGKTESLEAFKDGMFCLPNRSAKIHTDCMSPKTKTIHELKQQNKKLKISFDQLDEKHSQLTEGKRKLADDYTTLEGEYSSVLDSMTEITNQIASLRTEHVFEKEQLKNRLSTLQGEFSQQSEKLNEIQVKLASYTPRNVNKRQKRAQTSLVKERDSVRELQKENKSLAGQLEQQKEENEALEKKIENAESQINSLRKEKITLQKSLSYMRKTTGQHIEHIQCLKEENDLQMNEMQTRMKELQKSNTELEQLQVLMEDDIVTSFMDGKYINTVREVIMELLSMNISMNKVNDVIKIVLKKLAGKDIRLPSKAVHSRLLVEAKFIADVQVGKAMLANADPTSVLGNTLHGDGTSKYHRHYQDFEITTPTGDTYSIGLLEMGKSNAEAVIDAFKFRVEEIASALSDNQQEPTLSMKVAELITSVKNTMSDQGPINAPFNEQLETLRSELLPHVVDNWDNLGEDCRNNFKEMGNFYCKMHLLVNMAEEASKALKLFERAATEGQNPFAFASSNESGATRLTRTSCEAFHPRGSQNAGAASDFNAYLSEIGAGKNQMVQFIGNRFNILFYNAAAVFFHKKHIEGFLSKLPSLNRLQQLVFKDVTEAINLAGIQALGILDKVVTGPFFRVAENATSVLDLNPFLERMQTKFQEWSKDASSLLEGETLFDEALVPVHRDEVYDSLFAGQEEQVEVLTQEALELIFHSWIILLERQAKDQLPGGKYSNPSPDLQTQAKKVPATNMASERDFGLFDMLLRSKPSARVISYEALIMWTNNKTVAWLDTLPVEEKDKMMEEARHSFTLISQRYRLRKHEILQQKREKLLKKQQEKEQKETKLRQERVKLTAAVTALGGPWTTAENIVRGLQKLQSETKKREALVSQLQFQKIVIQAVPPLKEHFQQGKTVNGKRILFSVDQLSNHLNEVLIMNMLHQRSEEEENDGGLMYRTDADRKEKLTEERQKCAKKLREQRRKLAINRSREELPKLLEKPELLVGKRVQHNCIEGENRDIQDWFDAAVLRIASDNENTLKTEFVIKYDLEPDDLEWEMPLLTDLKNNDLIIIDRLR